jgi:hypothetical protein
VDLLQDGNFDSFSTGIDPSRIFTNNFNELHEMDSYWKVIPNVK